MDITKSNICDCLSFAFNGLKKCKLNLEKISEDAKAAINRLSDFYRISENEAVLLIIAIEAHYSSESTHNIPYIVVLVDEFSHLMLEDGKRFEKLIKRITAVARFCGIHLVISTNRCSADVITGIIKSNFPSQIAFAVTSGINSRILLDQLGAEKLLGSGDMLFSMGGWRNPIRVQGTFVDSINEANQKSKN